MNGTSVLVTPMTLMRMSRAIGSEWPASTPLGMPMPALAITRSMPPHFATKSAALSAMAAVSATSAA